MLHFMTVVEVYQKQVLMKPNLDETSTVIDAFRRKQKCCFDKLFFFALDSQIGR